MRTPNEVVRRVLAGYGVRSFNRADFIRRCHAVFHGYGMNRANWLARQNSRVGFDVRENGRFSKRLYSLRRSGNVERIGRGFYRVA